MFKRIMSVFLAVLLFCLVGCSPFTGSYTNSEEAITSSTDLIETLKEAEKITIKKSIWSLNKKYNIKADGKNVGSISGKYANITGDVFTLYDANGNKVASEKQIKRWGIKLNRLAEVYDVHGNTTGYIGEEKINDLFRIGYNFHFYDENRNEIGSTKDIFFSVLKKFEIQNNSGEVDYEINAKLNLFTSEYDIKIKNKESLIPIEQVLFFTCIVDAVMEAERKEER